jgi:hypothetical protein
MITIFCHFCQFSAEKMALFSKTDVMITIFAKTNRGLSKKKRKNFRKIFRRKYLKNHNIGPRLRKETGSVGREVVITLV